MKFANQIGYSDVNPYEVIKAISDKTMEIRAMKAEVDSSVKMEFAVGGFVAHCTNQSKQKWIITSSETAKVVRIRKNKKGEWRDASGYKYVLSETPNKYYDYNF